jgi:arsenate reductase
MKIYHNPRCSKSRQTLALLQEKGADVEIVEYLNNIPSKEELKSLIGYLGIEPLALVRKNESVWKENFKGKELSEEEILDAMLAHPKLIERPIVVKQKKAVLGRPPENVLSLL